MRLIDRIRKRTPIKDRRRGRIATTIGTVCAAVLATGMVVNPIGVVCLTVGAVVFGGKALFHAQKTVK